MADRVQWNDDGHFTVRVPHGAIYGVAVIASGGYVSLVQTNTETSAVKLLVFGSVILMTAVYVASQEKNDG